MFGEYLRNTWENLWTNIWENILGYVWGTDIWRILNIWEDSPPNTSNIPQIVPKYFPKYFPNFPQIFSEKSPNIFPCVFTNILKNTFLLPYAYRCLNTYVYMQADLMYTHGCIHMETCGMHICKHFYTC